MGHNNPHVDYLMDGVQLQKGSDEKDLGMIVSDHLVRKQLLNPLQSAYRKFHSTETLLLSIHDHLINAIGCQQVTCLCLLDLSAAFDTIDHSILLDRLSLWF